MTIAPTAERRRSVRVPVNMACSIDSGARGTLRDLSMHGLSFIIARGESIDGCARILLDASSGSRIELDVGVVWRKAAGESGEWIVGTEFRSLNPEARAALLSELSRGGGAQESESGAVELPAFTMLIGGEDVDTGVYEYYPFAAKSITDYSRVRRVIQELKSGSTPADAGKYIFGKFCVGTTETDRAAVAAAHKAFQRFSDFSLARRRRILRDMYSLLLENKKEFINLLMVEGHPRRLGEWQFEGMRTGSCPETIDYYCSMLRREISRRPGERLYFLRRPDGVVCVNPPGNASASSSYNGILAFLTGNTVVIRPSLHGPLSTIFLWRNVVHRALAENGAPPGTVNITVNGGNATMTEWIRNPLVSDIIHFGDGVKGLKIGAEIFSAGKKPILELSGNDFLLIWKDADLEKAAESLLDGFLGSTQVCMVPKIALVHHAALEEFARIFTGKVRNLKIAPPTDPDTVLCPVMKLRSFFEFLDDAVSNGGRLLCGGQRTDHNGNEDKDGIYLKPAVVRIDDFDAAMKMRFIREEIFFPMIPLIRVAGDGGDCLRAMLSAVNNHEYGMRVSFWCSSPAYTRRFVRGLRNCGILRINSRHIGFSPLLSTHGGTRRSGGPFGEMNYFWQKTSHLQGISRSTGPARGTA